MAKSRDGVPKAARSCSIASSVASTVMIGRDAFGARQSPWKTSMSECLLSQPLELAPDPRFLLLPQSAPNERGHDALRTAPASADVPGLLLFTSGADCRHQAIFPFLDRKSTRLNSSHGSISYAVFCLQ